MYALLDRAFKFVVKSGTLDVTDPAGNGHRYGDGTGTPVKIRIRDAATAFAIARDPDLGLGEAYMSGGVTLEKGTAVYDMLTLLMRNVETGPKLAAIRYLYAFRILKKRLDQYNPVGRAKANVAHHYDLS